MTLRIITSITLMLMGSFAETANAEQIIRVENWKPCSVGNNPDIDVPEWAKAEKLRKYYNDSVRDLSLHGLCNEKFKRIVLCDPDMDDLDPLRRNPAYNICRKYFDNNK
jgi:hypothetical protein